jgi:sugar (pentulose or hexulose) kinase
MAGAYKEASSRGAAIFALEALGLASTQLDPGEGRKFTPNPSATKAYAKAMERQEALYRALISN